MNREGREPGNAHLEPTIAPVRRPVSEVGSSPVRRWRWLRVLLLGLAGAVTVAGIVVVFGYLPEWVQDAAPEPEPAPVVDAAPAEAVPQLSEDELAALTAEAESLLAELLEQQQALNLRSAASWGDTTWSSYESAADAGDEALLAGDAQTAVDRYRTALEIGETLIGRSNNIVREALAAGDEAMRVGNSALAASQYELVLGIDPDNAAALKGLARAQTLPDVLAAIQRGDEAAEAGELESAAAAYRDALAMDAEFSAARTALNDVNRRIEDARFERLLNEGFAASEAGRFEHAAELFSDALVLRPDSSVAKDGLDRAEQGMQRDDITMAEVRARAFGRRELWDQAIERYREALATDPTLAFAIEGLKRAQARADLDAKLEVLNGEPARLLSEDVLADARELLTEAEAIAEPGPRLQQQKALLARLIELATTPIQVTLISDDETDVTVYRVGDLGSFTTREIALKPGNYTAVGQRRGYRDVRQSFKVLPGSEPEPVTVVCSERI